MSSTAAGSSDITIVGGGIVGLATALALSEKFPQARLAILEKEALWAAHQSGHNSGVIHSGIYYTAGSLRARLAREGNDRLVAFCQEEGIPYERCGKLIAAVDASELPRLEALAERGRANGVAFERLTTDEAKTYEPHLRCVAALWLPSTGIVDYRIVCERIARRLATRGAILSLNSRLISVQRDASGWRLETATSSWKTGFLITCGGLQSDRLARLTGDEPEAAIIPFRGEYHALRRDRRYLVKNLIYPVPDPQLPFLGVHFTRGIDGSVRVGPNAVLAFAREGYRRGDMSARDLWDMLRFGGFWRMARRFRGYAVDEWRRALSRRALTSALQRLVPDLREDDLEPASSGVRAQAVGAEGRLLDDFYLLRGERRLHVFNAPSPAATASLAIGHHIASSFQTPAEIL